MELTAGRFVNTAKPGFKKEERAVRSSVSVCLGGGLWLGRSRRQEYAPQGILCNLFMMLLI